MARSDQIRNSRYSQGGTVDVDGNRLGWWERIVFQKSPLDVTLTITKKYARRPDLLAIDMYGKANLQWFVLQFNNISDINEDFIEGKVITLPTKSRLIGEMLGKSSNI